MDSSAGPVGWGERSDTHKGAIVVFRGPVDRLINRNLPSPGYRIAWNANIMKKIILALFVVFIAVIASILFFEENESDQFTREIAEASKDKKKWNVSEIVVRYVPLGSSLADAIKFFGDRGFKAYKTNKADWGSLADDKTRYLIHKEKLVNIVILVATNIVIVTDGKIVLGISGKISLTGL